MDKDSIEAELAQIVQKLIEAFILFKPREKKSFLDRDPQMNYFDKEYLTELVKKKVRVAEYLKKRVPPDNEETQFRQVMRGRINVIVLDLKSLSKQFSSDVALRAAELLKDAVNTMEECEFVIDNEELFELCEKYEFADMLDGSAPIEYHNRRNEILRLLLEAQKSFKQLMAMTSA
ncbi:hypothetical protein J4219_01425 [Candidatus Woesearchaeota archaeon]|nr:hypothetical protein [Candidatus Woesearchaeota archaeon]